MCLELGGVAETTHYDKRERTSPRGRTGSPEGTRLMVTPYKLSAVRGDSTKEHRQPEGLLLQKTAPCDKTQNGNGHAANAASPPRIGRAMVLRQPLLQRSKLCVARGFNPVECMRLVLPFQRKGLCNALWNNYVGLPYGKDFPFCAICPGINPCATHRDCRWHSADDEGDKFVFIRAHSWFQEKLRGGI